jgi:hypothetical protein
MPALAHHGGDTILRKVCLPAGYIARSPCQPRIIVQDRTIESHAGISRAQMGDWVSRRVSKWRNFGLRIRLTGRWPREYLNEIE